MSDEFNGKPKQEMVFEADTGTYGVLWFTSPPILVMWWRAPEGAIGEATAILSPAAARELASTLIEAVQRAEEGPRILAAPRRRSRGDG